MRHITLAEVLALHQLVREDTGGGAGVLDLAGLESALAQPRMTFDGNDLYPSIAQKAAALGYSIISNHPFVDGNKRVGHAAMEAFLAFNGYELEYSVDDAETIILRVAAGDASREDLESWVHQSLRPQGQT